MRLPARTNRSARQLAVRAAIVGVAPVLAGAAILAAHTPAIGPQPTAGAGHGRGMGQRDALAYAQKGWTAAQILAHYYPGSALGTPPAAPVTVRLQGLDGKTLDAYSAAPFTAGGRRVEPGQAAHLTAIPGGGASVVITQGCAGEVVWQGQATTSWLEPAAPGAGRPAAEHLKLCGPDTAYRGALGVALEGAAPRVVNRVHAEDYLRGVVPAEMQPNWADQGGAEALRAQAITARSYALAEKRYPYAQTCDSTDCQVYPGTAKEDPRTTAAVASTAGLVVLRDGAIVRTEYSANSAEAQAAAAPPPPLAGPPALPAVPAAPPVAPSPAGANPPAESPIEVKYHEIGGPNSAVGVPIGPELPLPEEAGRFRLFTNGAIIWTQDLGVRVVDLSYLSKPEKPK